MILKSSNSGDSIIHRNNSHDCLDLIPKTALPSLFNFLQEHVVEPKDIKEIKTIIDLMKKNDLSVFEIEKEGFRLKLQRGPSSQAAAVAPLLVPPKAAGTGPESAPTSPKAIESVPLKEIV